MNKALLAVIAILVIALLATLGGLIFTILTENQRFINKLKNRTTKKCNRGVNELKKANLRLPNTVLPLRYNLTLNTQDISHNNKVFNGSVSILVNITEMTDQIILNIGSGINLDIENDVQVFETGSNDNIHNSKKTYISKDSELLIIQLTKFLDPNVTSLIRIEKFYSYYNQQLKGLYKSSYKVENKTELLITSQLQPTEARSVFPCFDEPAFKAIFKISIIRPNDFTSLSNAQLHSTRRVDSRFDIDEFKETPLMPTYVLGFIVSKFKYLETKFSGNKTLRVHVQPTLLEGAEISMISTKSFLEKFEKYFKYEYPLEKLDLVAVPDFYAGAMENWGLIIFRETSMIWHPEVSTAEYLEKVTKIVFHELGHMWFGNLVTLSWWKHLWLNEGFASFTETLGLREVYPDWYGNNSLHFELSSLLTTDQKNNTHPILVDVQRNADIDSLFDAISYVKGNAIINMIEGLISPEKFREILIEYFKRFAYKNVETDDLLNLLDEKTNGDFEMKISDILTPWLKQNGIPLVTMKHLGDDKFYISQERMMFAKAKGNDTDGEDICPEPQIFKWNSDEDDEDKKTLWPIPITFLTTQNSGNKTHEVFTIFAKQNMTLTIKFNDTSDWILLNTARKNYYSTNYDNKLWKRLADALMENHERIPVENRAMLIDDVMRLAMNNQTDFQNVMHITKYLKKEKHTLVWRTFKNLIMEINQKIMLTKYWLYFRKMVLSLVEPHLKDILWDYEPENINVLRHQFDNEISMLAATFDSREFRAVALEKYKIWKEKDMKPGVIANSVLGAMIYSVILHEQSEEFFAVLDTYRKYTQKPYLQNLLTGLAATREVHLLNEIINLNPPVVKHNPVLRLYHDSLQIDKHPLVVKLDSDANMHCLNEDRIKDLEKKNREAYSQSTARFMKRILIDYRDYASENIISRICSSLAYIRFLDELETGSFLEHMGICVVYPEDCGIYQKSLEAYDYKDKKLF